MFVEDRRNKPQCPFLEPEQARAVPARWRRYWSMLRPAAQTLLRRGIDPYKKQK